MDEQSNLLRRALDAVRLQVPQHEWDKFTDHFFAAFQSWREHDQKSRQAAAKPATKPKTQPKNR